MQVEFVFNFILSQNDDIMTPANQIIIEKKLFYMIKVKFVHVECFFFFHTPLFAQEQLFSDLS